MIGGVPSRRCWAEELNEGIWGHTVSFGEAWLIYSVEFFKQKVFGVKD